MEHQNIPRGIIISHNPVNKLSGNGKTIAAMFYQWDRSALAQIYITKQQPDFHICRNFYRITDKEVIMAFFRHREKVGHPIKDGEQVTEKKEEKASANKKKAYISSNSTVGWFVRNFFWNRKKWLHEGFMEWIDRQAPEFVFLAAGNLEAVFEIAELIAERRKIPLIVHIGDDYYSKTGKDFFFSEWKRKRLSKRLGDVIEKSQLVLAIGSKMADKFQELYGGNYITCMNCIDVSETYEEASLLKEEKKNYDMVYVGNLSVNRWKELSLIDEALKKIKSVQINLNIYSSIKNKKVLEKISKLQHVYYCGTVYGSKLHEIVEKADILLVLESFDKSVKRILETAMSTKIPECLHAGRPILAVGPVYSSTIEYLYENDLAEVVLERDVDKIADALRNLSFNKEEMKRRIEKGEAIVRNQFSLKKNSEMVFEVISEISLKGRMEKNDTTKN